MKKSLLGLYLICLLFSSSIVSASVAQFSENSETLEITNLSSNLDPQIQTSNSLAESLSVKDSYVLKKNGILISLKNDISGTDSTTHRDSVAISELVILSKQSLPQTNTTVMAITERILERSKLSKQSLSLIHI